MVAEKERLLTGAKPTGRPHLGNYFGAMKPFKDLQDQNRYECFFMIADYHGLNFIQNKSEMETLSKELALDFLGIGIDPKNLTLFKQSAISEHTELAWIFDTITTMPYLMRAHAFKDAGVKSKDISVGTFNYPMLMASDILLYDTSVVPVGQDQKQHVEYARDTAEKFNRIYGATFKLPREHIQETSAIVPGIDGHKMSKSYNNIIPLFGSREEIVEAVTSIVTDSIGENPKNVYAIHRLLVPRRDLDGIYALLKGNYKKIKERLIEDLETLISPMRERREYYKAHPKEVENILSKGTEKARGIASVKMVDVRQKIGVA